MINLSSDKKHTKGISAIALKQGLLVMTTVSVLFGTAVAASADEAEEYTLSAGIEDETAEDFSSIGGLSLFTSDKGPFTNISYTHGASKIGMNIAYGIDVSKYNGNINWKKVKAAGVEFAFIRIGNTYSGTREMAEDPYFRKNIEGAQAVGIKVGVYYYSCATSASAAKKEAEFVLGLLDGYTLDLPVVDDPDFLDCNLTNSNLSKKTYTKIVDTFCDTIREGGYSTMVYGGIAKINDHLDYETCLQNNEIWIARYNNVLSNSKYTYKGDYSYWQYTDTGVLPGVSGSFDCNFYYYTPEVQTPVFTTVTAQKSQASLIGSVEDVTAKAADVNAIKLSWTANEKAAGYHVYRSSTVSGTFEFVADTTATSYLDTELEEGKTYYYKVVPFGYLSSSSDTEETSATAVDVSDLTSETEETADASSDTTSGTEETADASSGAVSGTDDGEDTTAVGEESAEEESGSVTETASDDLQEDLAEEQDSMTVDSVEEEETSDLLTISNVEEVLDLPEEETTEEEEETTETEEAETIDGFASAMVTSFTKNYADVYVRVNNLYDLNLRETPGTSGTIIMKIPKNTKLYCYASTLSDNGIVWYYVRYKSGGEWYRGYISSGYADVEVQDLTGLSQTETKYHSITLSWDRQSGITGYMIYRSDAKNGTYERVAYVKDSAVTSWTDTDLDKNTEYWYKVCAYSKVNEVVTKGTESTLRGTTGGTTFKVRLTTSSHIRAYAGTSFGLKANLPKNKVLTVMNKAHDKSGALWYRIAYVSGGKTQYAYVKKSLTKKV